MKVFFDLPTGMTPDLSIKPERSPEQHQVWYYPNTPQKNRIFTWHYFQVKVTTIVDQFGSYNNAHRWGGKRRESYLYYPPFPVTWWEILCSIGRKIFSLSPWGYFYIELRNTYILAHLNFDLHSCLLFTH